MNPGHGVFVLNDNGVGGTTSGGVSNVVPCSWRKPNRSVNRWRKLVPAFHPEGNQQTGGTEYHAILQE